MPDQDDKGIVPNESEPEKIPEALKEVAQELGEERVRRIINIVQEHYSGPLPHPRQFAQFGEVLPTAPERILRMAEKQQEMEERRLVMEEKEQEFDHRMRWKMLEGDERRANWGLGLGAFIFVVVFGAAMYLIIAGYQTAGYIALATLALNGIVNFIRVGRERIQPSKSDIDE